MQDNIQNVTNILESSLLDEINKINFKNFKDTITTDIKYKKKILDELKDKEIQILELAAYHSKNSNRKEFALTVAKTLDPLTKSCVFSVFDTPIMFEVRKVVKSVIISNLTKNVNYDKLCSLWFNNERYN